MALIRFFYLFNVEYRSVIEGKLSFIQKFFLNINDKSKTIDKSVPNLRHFLKRNLMDFRESLIIHLAKWSSFSC